MDSSSMGEITETVEQTRPKVSDPRGILQQNRVFLDFFWDIAKPEQEVRLKAIQDLITYLKNSDKADELDYTLKRLVEGLAHTREVARPGFSLALGQLLSTDEDIPLQAVFNRIKETHNLELAKKKLIRNVAFGNFFGVLALSQSTRLPKEPQVVLGCVQLLQSLSKHREHLKDLPGKTMVDILSETPEEVFDEVLLGALQSDLSSAFSTPEQLQLLLVAMERFPQSLKPKKLKKLLGTSIIVTEDNIPKLTEVLKMAARSVKNEPQLPAVALDLLKISLKEGTFQLFWTKAIVQSMFPAGAPKNKFEEQSSPTQFLSFRLLGAALPLLSLSQLKDVLSGEVMKRYGEHVVSAQQPKRFKLAPEMDVYVADFLQGCEDPDKQLAVMLSFSTLTNEGYPVVPSVWRVVQHLRPAALQRYVAWLKAMFLHPQLDICLDFSTRRQKDNPGESGQKESGAFRLRKWIVARLTSIVENQQVKRDEDLVMDVARFVFFHAFFTAQKVTPDIPETEGKLSMPLDNRTRAVTVGSFFGLLQHMHHMPMLGDSAEVAALNQKRVLGVTADGTLWVYCLVQYAQILLNQPKYVESAQPFSPEQRHAWDGMLESVAALMKKAKKSNAPETNAFQQLFLLVGIHLFKAPEDLVDIMKDLQNCMEKAQDKKSKKKKKPAKDQEEPHWVEVVVDILLSLLSQPSRHIRQVCKTVFSSVCPHITATALTAILDVLDPDKDEDESAVVVTDDMKTAKKKKPQEFDEDEDMEEEESGESDDDEEDDDDDDDDDDDNELMEEQEQGDVDPNFRLSVMKVLHDEDALPTEEDGSDDNDEELDDEAMMKLDKGLAMLFSEQKKKIEAKKDEKKQLHKEKTLVRDFKIKVLDLLEVFLDKQRRSPLVLGMLEPLLTIIERGMSSDSDQQEQDFLRRAADIFKNQLCRSKSYCKTVGDRQGELHDLIEKLMTKARKQADSSVSYYFFSASLYLVKVLRSAAETKEEKTSDTPAEELLSMGSLDVDRVVAILKDALRSFMTKRKCPLTAQMFIDILNKFPALFIKLLDTAVENITSGVREHQQGQACVLVLRSMQSREVQLLLAGAPWTELYCKTTGQLAQSFGKVEQSVQKKVEREKMEKSLELCKFMIKRIHQEKLSVDLEPLKKALQPLTGAPEFNKSGCLADTYWAIMRPFGAIRPKMQKTKKMEGTEEEGQEDDGKKKKGFLPETKKRSNRTKKKMVTEGPQNASLSKDRPEGDQQGQARKKNKKKRSGDGQAPSQPSPAKKAKSQPGSTQAKTPPTPTGKPAKKKHKKQGGGHE